MNAPTVIVNYDPNWPRQFEQLRSRIAHAVGRLFGRRGGSRVGMTMALLTFAIARKSLLFRNGEGVEESACLPATSLLPAESEFLASLGMTKRLGMARVEAGTFRPVRPYHSLGRSRMFTFLLWCILFILCWPLALLALVAYPFIWLLLLPFRIVGVAVHGVLEVIYLAITLPFRLLAAPFRI